MVEDVDYSDIEDLEQSLDEMDEKIECSHVYVVQNLFIPIMHVSENIGSRANQSSNILFNGESFG